MGLHIYIHLHPSQVKDCLLVYADFDEPKHKNRQGKIMVHYGDQGLMIRSFACYSQSLSKSPPMATICKFSCQECINVAESVEELTAVVRMAVKLDHLLLAEAKCFGTAGAKLVLTDKLQGRSYTENTPEWLLVKDRVTPEKHLAMAIQDLSLDRTALVSAFGSVPQKNAALELVYLTRVKNIVLRATKAGDLEDAMKFAL